MRGDANAIPAPIQLASDLDEAADTAVTITKSGVAGSSHVLVGVEYSYQAGTPVGKLTIKDGSTTVKEWDVTGEGDWSRDFSAIKPTGGLPMTEGNDLVVVLGAAGALAVGKLNITHR